MFHQLEHGPIICFTRTSHSTGTTSTIPQKQDICEPIKVKREDGDWNQKIFFWFHIVWCMMPCLPAFQANHHFHMRLKFGATFGLRVDSVTPSAPIFTPACAYLFPSRLANHNSYQISSNVCMYMWVNFFWSENLLPQGREATKAGWPQWNCSPTTEVTQGFHAGSLLF